MAFMTETQVVDAKDGKYFKAPFAWNFTNSIIAGPTAVILISVLVVTKFNLLLPPRSTNWEVEGSS